MQAHVQPQLLRRLRESAAAGAAGGGLAAGTDDDPICLDSDDRRPGCGQQAAQPRGDVMAVGQAAGAGAEADADLPPAADGDVEMADGEQLADGGGWQGGDEGVPLAAACSCCGGARFAAWVANALPRADSPLCYSNHCWVLNVSC